jgi:hypothetical protein
MRRYNVVTREVENLELEEKACDCSGCDERTGSEFWEKDGKVRDIRLFDTILSSGRKVVFQADICPKCFEEKVIPFLKDLGIDVVYKDA